MSTCIKKGKNEKPTFEAMRVYSMLVRIGDIYRMYVQEKFV
jgi:hypothetical protein